MKPWFSSLDYKMELGPWLLWLIWLAMVLCIERLLVRFLVRACWAQFPGWGWGDAGGS